MSASGRGPSPTPPSHEELRQAVCEAAEHNRRLEGERAALRETLRRLEDDEADLAQRVAAEAERSRELEARLQDKNSRRAQLRSDIEALCEEHAVLEVEIAGAERMLERLRGQEAELTQELARSRELAGEAREALERAQASILRMDYRLRHDGG